MKILQPFIQQFKKFFANIYSKVFIVICLIVIGLGSVNSFYTVSNLKGNIDAQIAQREEELNKLLEVEYQAKLAEYKVAWEAYERCSEKHERDPLLVLRFSCIEPLYFLSFQTKEGYFQEGRLRDASYRELLHIKNTPSLQLFFEKLGLTGGSWGIIILFYVFVINILIVPIKFLWATVSTVVRASGNQAVLAKNNIKDMPAFQKYFLLIAILMLITMLFILAKL